MVQYIKELAAETLERIKQRESLFVVNLHFKALMNEIARLDPRDFLAAAQYRFVKNTLSLGRSQSLCEQLQQKAGGPNEAMIKQLNDSLSDIISTLDCYGGTDSHLKYREFPFIKDPDMRGMIERDYRELSSKLMPSGAWKSAVVMAGSILEAVLLDYLSSDPAREALAKGSPKAVDNKGRVAPIKEWKLERLIDVACDIGLLSSDRAATIHIVLRDYRNFVHPLKEKRAKHACGEPEALMSFGCLQGICDTLK